MKLLSFLLLFNMFSSQYTTLIQYAYTENYPEFNDRNNYQVYVLANQEEVYQLFIHHKNYKNYSELMNDKDYNSSKYYMGSLYHNFSEDTFYGVHWVENNYLYKDVLPQINWKISKSEEQILGYNTQIAEGELRGRKYRLWFTTDIPIDIGPWKFKGLPGAVLKAVDDSGLISFEAVSIMLNTNVAIPDKINNYYMKKEESAISYKKVIEIENKNLLDFKSKFSAGLPKESILMNDQDEELVRLFLIEKSFEWE